MEDPNHRSFNSRHGCEPIPHVPPRSTLVFLKECVLTRKHAQLILFCGLPSSGKTYRARQLVTDFEARIRNAEHSPTQPSSTHDQADGHAGSATTTSFGPNQQLAPKRTSRSRPLTLHYISDHTLHIPRSAYAASAAEKTARATISTAVKRALGRDAVVVVDSGNYIKGWRYQLHCEAKAVGVRSCVLQIGVLSERARAINAQRFQAKAVTDDEERRGETSRAEIGGDGEGEPYDGDVWEELAMRFEEPNGMTRWDSPLFPVVWDDAAPPCDRIWDEVVRGVGRDGKTLGAVKPNKATVLVRASKFALLGDTAPLQGADWNF